MAEIEALSPDEAAPATSLRARILAEATRLFAERGYNATSMREIVEACGCTKPALYYYFKNKEALFLEVLETEAGTVTAMVEREVGRVGAGEGHIREVMTSGLERYFTHVLTKPIAIRVLVRADMQPDEGQPVFDFQSLRAMHMEMVKVMLELGVERGEVRGDLDVEDAAYALSGIIDQRLQRWLEGTPFPPDLAERLMDIFFRGVAT